MKKKLCALIMALVLAMSLMPMSVFATEGDGEALSPEQTTQAEKQIKVSEDAEYLYFDYDEESGAYKLEGGAPESILFNTDVESVPVVTTEKTILPTGIENQFDIKLTVTTTQTAEELFVDTAVVLVFDISGSMDKCLICGAKYFDTKGEACTDDTHKFANSRLYAAEEAAKTFLYSYAGYEGEDYTDFSEENYTNPQAKRYVSMVTFNGSTTKLDTLKDSTAQIVPLTGDQQWIDLHQGDPAETLTKAYKTIDGLDAKTNTNVDAGLYYAEDLLDLLGTGDVPKIDYTSVILLCDGEPTAWLEAPSGAGYELPSGADEALFSDEAYQNPAKRAMHMRNQDGAKFYSISFNAGETAANWLGSFSDDHFDASDLTDLVNAFKQLQEDIKKNAATWYVEDQLSEYVKCIQLTDTDAVQIEDGKIHWDLTQEEPTYTDPVTYELTYQIILDTNKLVEENLVGKYLATSQMTKLHYIMTQEDSAGNVIYIDENGEEIGLNDALELEMDFVCPAIKGYAGDLSFLKYGETKENPVVGAKFKLTHDGDLCDNLIAIGAKTATSGEDGNVTFAKLPSGHTYTLSETEAPSGYQKITGSMDVAVNYGEVTSDVDDGLKNEPTALTVKKAVRGPVDEDAVYTITITGPAAADGEYNTADGEPVAFENGKATVELKANESIVIKGLPNGTYTLTEEQTSAGSVNIPNHKWTVENGEATISNNAATATITNVYSDWEDVNLSIPVNKEITVSGKASTAPADTVFTFQVKDEAGNVVDTASWKNTAEDTLTAAPVTEEDGALNVTLTDVGTYTFTVSEVDDASSSNWTYDDTVYTVTVTVEEAVVDIRPLSRSEDLPKLAITSCTITKPAEPVEGDQGDAPAEPQPEEVENATFVNNYHRSGGGGTIIPDNPPPLNKVDHYGYIIGYPKDYETGERTEDQTRMPVMPEGNITRAEVATIFFRMLTDEGRADVWSQTCSYSDVELNDWFNNAVCTLSNAGIINGYADGTFRPNANITRAEFATIASRFFDATYEGEDIFPDIDGHWAADYINNAANNGIIQGYPDGTFGPNKKITRAEAVTMVNRTLDRAPDQDYFLKDMLVWVDNMDTTKWYYADMQEATNSHTYDMEVKNDGTMYEKWTKMLPIRDWAELEREWSDANSAPGGDVV